jgi:hypothetical protein
MRLKLTGITWSILARLMIKMKEFVEGLRSSNEDGEGCEAVDSLEYL